MVKKLEPEAARRIAEIAVNAPVLRLFHYQVPGPLASRLELGHRVLVPFGRQKATGVCVGFNDGSQPRQLKDIQEILHPECRFDEHLLQLTRWIAGYYHASWGEVLEAALPPGIRAAREKKQLYASLAKPAGEAEAAAAVLEKRARMQARALRHLAASPGPHLVHDLLEKLAVGRECLAELRRKGWITISREAPSTIPGAPGSDPNPDVEEPADPGAAAAAAGIPLEIPASGKALTLHADQRGALEKIQAVIDRSRSSPDAAPPPILIHGVTGSGKTEVYLRALRGVIAGGGRGLVLVPEISLTPQTVRRFRDGLPGVPIAVLHSMLGRRRRAEEWRDILTGRPQVVIGARSAVFAPVPELRLIVVDEEHEPSYKQESSPRYHGRDAAILRAHLLKIPIILGTATPSLESYHHCRTGKYQLIEMPSRVTPHDLPAISVIPLTPEFYRPDGMGLITDQLDFQIRDCLRRREQAILFLNRRGFSTFLHCTRCGFVLKCRYCDITLTYHKQEGLTQCHYCNARYEFARSCPDCKEGQLRRAGVGTEKVEQLISRRYAEARVGRMDRDTVKSHDAMNAILEKFAEGKTDILVGTQMIAKGLDFPRVSLVGIITADTGLQFPDFRSAERAFQLITQVAGRAGRGERPGRVIVQTFFPDHYAIRFALKNDYGNFFKTETEHRQALGYPPFGRLARILIQDENPERGLQTAATIASRLRNWCDLHPGEAEVLGPAPAPITRIEERHRFQILVKAAASAHLQAALLAAEAQPGGRATREVIVDVDPQNLL